jgi:hypothetical protein
MACAILLCLYAPLHVFKVEGVYSGESFGVTFFHEPTEEDFLDSVIDREPLIRDAAFAKREWRDAQKAQFNLNFKFDENHSVRVMPYEWGWGKTPYTTRDVDIRRGKGEWFTEPSKEPAIDFNGSNIPVKEHWLTEPSTRNEFSPVATLAIYFASTFLIVFLAAFYAPSLIGYLLNNYRIRRVSISHASR